MATPTFDISNQREGSTTRRPQSDGESLRYRLDVIAASASDVVQAAGGWLCDRVMAGWEVTVLLPDLGGSRPLQILGVHAAALDTYPEAGSHNLAVSAQAFIANDCVRDLVREALDRRMVEVALWGEGWPLGVNRGMRRVEHVLSAAARAFKGQALIAAGIPYRAIDPCEAMLTA
ncbi:hypothetical protein BST27_03790 [Mycobacterium intermedium]|uniref:Uncharacterized protein n=1 Tax=Mycobacterium intermedium TaxID=28445 RepID=A0A1E3SKB9_MYCIE|nr:hypothetical protein [Mycobacterium intermedium]MCV6962834.1 hypothetical protein [Mycobacterium intermedium]ODR02561.1 hypothetical protein BHQ20_03330 [Mycobacterium intermedium]OPE46910.1 hypothetical protein BV508_24070 [Mycobacterium intermedium]ORB09928.1 hypothetical protein BST27_03790 [Mycobacterium intermedium]